MHNVSAMYCTCIDETTYAQMIQDANVYHILFATQINLRKS